MTHTEPQAKYRRLCIGTISPQKAKLTLTVYGCARKVSIEGLVIRTTPSTEKKGAGNFGAPAGEKGYLKKGG